MFEDPLVSHNLAILFLVIALGALLDLEGQAHSQEAKWYYQLGKAALALEPVLDSSSLSTIQALVCGFRCIFIFYIAEILHQILLAYYMLLDDIHDLRWSIMGLTSKLTQTVSFSDTIWS